MTVVRRAGPGSRSLAFLQSMASGVLMTLAYPNFDLWPLVFVAFAPLMLALRG